VDTIRIMLNKAMQKHPEWCKQDDSKELRGETHCAEDTDKHATNSLFYSFENEYIKEFDNRHDTFM